MQTRFIAATALAGALALTPAFAARAADTDHANPPPGQAATAPANMPAVAQQYPADKLIGHDVKNGQGDSIGEIDSIILDPNGKAAAVIVGVGGFLGLGERTVAIDWRRLQIARDGDEVKVTTDLSKSDLKAMPAYTYPENAKRHASFQDRNYNVDRTAPAANAPAGTASNAPEPNAAAANADRDRASDRPANVETAQNDRNNAPAQHQADQPEGKTVKSDAQGRVYLSSLNGTDLVNSTGDKIGSIDDILIDRNGRPELLVSVGGFLGIGNRDVLVPWNKLKIGHNNRDNVVVSLPMTKDELKAIPEYKK